MYAETQREGRGHAGGGEWRMECGFEPGGGQHQVEHNFESDEWFRSVNLPPVGNQGRFLHGKVSQRPRDVRYLKPFTDAHGKPGLPVTILQEQEGFFTVSPASSFTPSESLTKWAWIRPPTAIRRSTSVLRFGKAI